MVRRRRWGIARLAAPGACGSIPSLPWRRASGSHPCFSRRFRQGREVNNALGAAPHGLLSRLGAIDERAAFYLLIFFGTLVTGLVLATPFAFWKYGDNAYVVIAIATGLAALGAAAVAERAVPARALWLIFGVAVLSRLFLLFLDPLLSTDIYRYIWDG